jgi:oligosaccharide repeat unit polymerase
MLEIIIFIVLIIAVSALVIIERNQYKTYLTPFILFSVPYIIIIFYQVLVTNIYRWKNVSAIYLFYVLIYLITFYFVGAFTIQFMKSFKRNNQSSSNIQSCNYNQEMILMKHKHQRLKIIEIISLASSIYLIIFFIFSSRGLYNVGMVVQEEFQSKYSTGVNFYLRLFCMIGTIYFWGLSNKSNRKFILLGFLCFIPNFLSFVKGIAFINVIGSVLANLISNKRKIKVSVLLKVLLVGLIIFFLVYMIEIGIWNPNKLFERETYEFIYGKLNSYLVSGVQSFNINISNSENLFKGLPNPVYAPVINLIAKLGLAERIEAINNVWITIGYIPNYGPSTVNTNTYIGTLSLYCGFFIGLLVNSIISTIIYYFFWKAIRTQKTIHIVRYSLMVTGLVLAWFEYYYMQTFWFYLVLIFFLIDFINRFRIVKNKKINKKYIIKESV